MTGLLRSLLHRYQTRKRERTARTTDRLKAHYHIFRALLDTNNRAVDLVTELGARLRHNSAAPEIIRPTRKLIAATADLADKLNALTDNREQSLFTVHRLLAHRIESHLEQLPPPVELPLCLPLAAVTAEAAPAVGAKAAALARLCREGRYPVPDGFAVTLTACRRFLDHDGLSLRLLATLQKAAAAPGVYDANQAAAVQEAIRQAPLPQSVEEALLAAARPLLDQGRALAVRSSALAEDGRHHSFAGQFATVLNVATAEALIDAFREVMASSFNRRSLAYRLNAGLDPLTADMAVCCLEMIQPRAAGVLLTRSPLPGHDGPLITAVYGLGQAAVGGSAPADCYLGRADGTVDWQGSTVVRKEERLICRVNGGIGSEPVPLDLQRRPALSEEEIATLIRWGRELEAETGTPQDIEWLIGPDRQPRILQARPITGTAAAATGPAATGPVLLSGGVTAAGGSATGQVRLVASRDDLKQPVTTAVVLVLHQSLAEAVSLLPDVAAILVDYGNPADHLALVARETGVPMLCALGNARRELADGQWVTVDGGAGSVHQATEEAIAAARQAPAKRPPPPPANPEQSALYELIVPLHLTDANDPGFTAGGCRSLHDIVRYVHEKGVLAMFEANDEALEAGGLPVRLVESEVPFLVNLIDLGGSLAPDEKRRRVPASAVLSIPFAALWQGIATPGLHWGPPPGGVDLGSVTSTWLTDQRQARPLGMPNYVIVSRDYLNLNARMDFHFTMIDALCGLDARSNYIRFRFKGGGTSIANRRRRARCIGIILEAHDFLTEVRDDLVNASLAGAPLETLTDKLVVLGRLLGFTRLLDAAMRDEGMVERVAEAFLAGNYSLAGLETETPSPA